MAEALLPLIFGHRGASAHAPENSLAAFHLAMTQGADGLELDTLLTADGQVVIMHDDEVDATTDGHGAVSALTLDQLRRLHLRARGKHTTATIEPVPTLAEVLDAFGHGPITLNVEIKPTKTADLAEAVAQLVVAHHATEHVLLSSFDRGALAHIQEAHPDLRRALLYPNSSLAGVMAGLRNNLAWLTGAHALGCEAVHPFWKLATPTVIERAHTLNLDVNVWTVDSEHDIRRLSAAGVDGIITNEPARARAALVGVPVR